MKRFYVTNKQVDKYITRQQDRLSLNYAELLGLVDDILIDLECSPQVYDEAQIKFYTRVRVRLNNLRKSSAS